jgi:hypothetical protein
MKRSKAASVIFVAIGDSRLIKSREILAFVLSGLS